MSDQIGQVASTNAVSSTSAAAPVRADGLAEVQYYNIKAIGVNRVMGGGGDNDVPLGAAVNAYTGDASTEVSPSSTRSLMEAGNGGFPTPDPAPAEGGFTPVEQSPPQQGGFTPVEQSPPQQGGFTPVDESPAPTMNVPPPSSPAPAPQDVGNPYMQQSPSAPPPPQVQQQAVISNTQPTLSSNKSVASINNNDTKKDEEDEDRAEPFSIGSIPQNERDFALDSPLDDKPQDTWAPNAKRSKEFAALDNMKLTSPEEALAQWRSQQESAARNQDSAGAPPVPAAQAQPQVFQQASSYAPPQPDAAPPSNPYMGAPAAIPAPPPQPQQVPTGPGNPYMAPPQAPGMAPAPSSQAMPLVPQAPAASAPVDLSEGSYSNPNLNGPGAATMRGTNPVVAPMVNPTPAPVDQRMPVPNAPYILPGGPQGMYQNRFQNMAGLNPSVNPFNGLDDDEDEEKSDDEDSDGDMMNPMSPTRHHNNTQPGPYSYLNEDDVLPGVMGTSLLRRLGNYGA